jgi:F0F1-type ATP synthase assembly protein I
VAGISKSGPNGEQPSAPRPPSLWRYAAIGVEFFSPIIGGSVAGYYIDQYFRTGATWTLVGLLGGVFLAFFRLILEMREFRRSLTK